MLHVRLAKQADTEALLSTGQKNFAQHIRDYNKDCWRAAAGMFAAVLSGVSFTHLMQVHPLIRLQFPVTTP